MGVRLPAVTALTFQNFFGKMAGDERHTRTLPRPIPKNKNQKSPKPRKPPPAAEPDAAEAAPDDLDSLSRSELRRKLLRQGLSASGSKVELIRRIRDLGL